MALACSFCGLADRFAFNRKKITFCRGCGKNFTVTSENAREAEAYLKARVREIPEDALACEYCGGWVWVLKADGRPAYCGGCGKNYPIYMNTDIKWVPEKIMDANTRREVLTGRMIPAPGQELAERPLPDPVPGAVEAIRAQNDALYAHLALPGEGSEIPGNIVEPANRDAVQDPGLKDEEGELKPTAKAKKKIGVPEPMVSEA